MALPLKIDVLPEPELEFANASRDVDPRRGLAANGPVDNRGLRIDPARPCWLARRHRGRAGMAQSAQAVHARFRRQLQPFPRLAWP